MKGSLLKGKEISSLPLRLHEHKRYGVKKFILPICQGSWISRRHCFFCLYQCDGGC